MARKRPGQVAARRVAATVAVFVGIFVICFGFGYGSRAVSLAGAAVVLFAGAFRVVARLRGSIRQWVVGTGRVMHVSDPPSSTPYGRCELQLLVDAPGLPREIVVIREPRVAIREWPYVDQELPIEVAADDVRNVRILWPDREPGDAEDELGPMWDDDQPAPAPAEPPRSHLDRDLDVELDGPPGVLLGTPVGVGDMTPGDEGGTGDHVPVPETTRRVPHPRPRPRPRPEPEPAEPEPDVLATYPSAHPGPGGAIHRVGVTLHVADLDRSVSFYRDTLGFHEVDRGGDTVVLASGENRLVLRTLAGMEPVHRRVVHLSLDVTDIEAVYAELRSAGVRFTSPPRVVDRGTRSEQWAAVFTDPDGHGLALTQWRAIRV